MDDRLKIEKGVTLFRELLPDARGAFRACVSETNGNEVEFFTGSGYYCTINVRTRRVKGI